MTRFTDLSLGYLRHIPAMNNFGHWEVSLSASTSQHTQNGWSPGGSIALLQYNIQEPVEGSGAVTLYQCIFYACPNNFTIMKLLCAYLIP